MRKQFLSLALLLLTAVGAFGDVLTIEEAVDRALENSEAVRSARFDLQEAEYAEKMRFTSLLPQAELFGSVQDNYGLNSDIAPYAGLGGELSLQLSASDFFAIQRRGRSLEAADLSLKKAEQSVISNIKRSCYKLILLQEEVELSEQQVATAAKKVADTRYDWESGKISRYDLLNAQLSYDEQLPLLQAKNLELRQHADSLAAELGMKEGETLQLDGELTPPEINLPEIEDLEVLIEQNPEISSARLSLEENRSKRSEKRSSFLPQASVSLGRAYSFPFDGGSVENDSLNWKVSLSVSLSDLLPWSGRAAEIRSLEEEAVAWQRSIEDTRQSINRQARYLLEKIDRAETDLENGAKRLELADRFLEIARQEYEQGKRGSLELEDAEIKQAEAEVMLLEKRYNLLDLFLQIQDLLALQGLD